MLVNYRFLLRSTIGGRAIAIVAVCLFVCLSCASKPERANLNGTEPATVDEMPSEEKRKVVWGEAIRGLQAGIYIVANSLRVGDIISPTCYVRNTSARPIEFRMFEPSLAPPRIHDATGARVPILGAISSLAVRHQKHTLEPGGSIALHLNTYVLATRRPVFYSKKNGVYLTAIAATSPGKYQVGYELEVTLLNDETQRIYLHSGWADLVVLLGDREALSKRVASELRRAADRFNLKIVRMAEQGSPLRSLRLTVLEPKSQYPEFWSTVQISRKEAEAIIGHLERTDYLWRTVAEPYDRKAFSIPSYFLSLSLGDESDPKQLFELGPLPLGWGLEMDCRLKELREMFVGESRKAMDKLLAQLEHFRKEWRAPSTSSAASLIGKEQYGAAISQD